MERNYFSKYLTYSLLIHLTFLGWLVLTGFSRTAKTYYAVDFLGGGMPSGGAPRGASRQTQKEIKTNAVNPQEDLLLKSKKKSVPAIPIPKAPSRVESEPS